MSMARSCTQSGKNTHPQKIRIVSSQRGFLGNENYRRGKTPHQKDFYGASNFVEKRKKWGAFHVDIARANQFCCALYYRHGTIPKVGLPLAVYA